MSEAITPEFDIRKRLRPRAYSIAIYVVAVFILLQLAALGSIFWFRQTVITIEISDPTLTGKSAPLTIHTSNTPKYAEVANLEPKQEGARLNLSKEGQKEARIHDLNEEAITFRRQNNFHLAQAALQRAIDLDSDHPNTLANMAMLQEAMGKTSKALEYWQHIITLGNKASSTVRLARERSLVLEDQIRQEKVARDRETVVLHPPRKIFLEKISIKPWPIPSAPPELDFDFIIHVGKENIDPGKMRLQVFLYDKLPNYELTTARIDARFLNSQPLWQTNGSEVLRAHYSKAAQERSDTRQYYGYIVRVIYEDTVQDEKSEPQELLQRFPYQANGK